MATTAYQPGRMERTDDNGLTSAKSGRNGPSILLIGFLIVAAFAVAFFLRNGHETEVDFVFGEVTTTLRWSLLLAVALGVVLDRLVAAWWRRARRRNR